MRSYIFAIFTLARLTVAAPATFSTSSEAAELVARATVEYKGKGTFYGGNLDGGACLLQGYTIPSNLVGTALSSHNWDGSAACGSCISVTGPRGKVTAMVVDKCPECDPHHVDLFQKDFPKIGDPIQGVIPVTWHVVPCGISTPIQLKNKEGAGQYWFSMQVRNANVGVARLEVSVNGGRWMPTTRQDYNFFNYQPGFRTAKVDVKITSVNNDVIIVNGVSVSDSAIRYADRNF